MPLNGPNPPRPDKRVRRSLFIIILSGHQRPNSTGLGIGKFGGGERPVGEARLPQRAMKIVHAVDPHPDGGSPRRLRREGKRRFILQRPVDIAAVGRPVERLGDMMPASHKMKLGRIDQRNSADDAKRARLIPAAFTELKRRWTMACRCGAISTGRWSIISNGCSAISRNSVCTGWIARPLPARQAQRGGACEDCAIQLALRTALHSKSLPTGSPSTKICRRVTLRISTFPSFNPCSIRSVRALSLA